MMSQPLAKPRDLVFPLLLIFLGVTQLLQNYHLISRHVWDRTLPLWPLLLVLFGLQFLVTTRLHRVLFFLLTFTPYSLILLYATGAITFNFQAWTHSTPLPLFSN